MNKKRGRPVSAVDAAAAPLGREAERLLAALAQPGAYAFPDPDGPDSLILRRDAGGVSLGGGRFPAAAGLSLRAAGLAEPECPRSTRLVIGTAGRARLRRRAAPGETAFLAQHLELVVDAETPAHDTAQDPGRGAARASGEGPTLRDAAESPLAWMARRRGRDGAPLIDAAAFAAGERLRRDMTLACMLPRIGPDWGRPRVDGGGPRDPAAASDTVLAAKARVDRALDAVGADMRSLLIDLCGFLKGLERIETERGWPARSAKVVAKIALGRLAEHYGLGREAVGPASTRARLWRAH